jgi:tol-pal system protein YbgF
MVLVVPAPSVAQDQTLADIRQELSVLFVEMQRLKRELSTTGAVQSTVGGSPLDRINALEAALQRLTRQTEDLEFRLNKVVVDGTNRIGDLEFRLVELEGGDVSQLGETSTLGGVEVVSAATPPSNQSSFSDLAVGEAADFKAAELALSAGDYATATELLSSFAETYPGSPVAVQAHFMRGQAFEGLGDISNAARAYLQAFSSDPAGPTAPDALYKLGASLGALGQQNEACVTLNEVGLRFPASTAVPDARAAMAQFGCS